MLGTGLMTRDTVPVLQEPPAYALCSLYIKLCREVFLFAVCLLYNLLFMKPVVADWYVNSTAFGVSRTWFQIMDPSHFSCVMLRKLLRISMSSFINGVNYITRPGSCSFSGHQMSVIVIFSNFEDHCPWQDVFTPCPPYLWRFLKEKKILLP